MDPYSDVIANQPVVIDNVSLPFKRPLICLKKKFTLSLTSPILSSREHKYANIDLCHES